MRRRSTEPRADRVSKGAPWRRRLADGQEVVGRGDVTLFAVWAEDCAWVAFDANGGAGEMEPLQLTDGATMPECAFTREGHAFAYWCKRADGASRGWAAGGPADGLGSCTLYAIWVPEGAGADVPGNDAAPSDPASEPASEPAPASAPAGSPWDRLGGCWAPALAAASGGSAAWAACMAIAACAAGRRDT